MFSKLKRNKVRRNGKRLPKEDQEQKNEAVDVAPDSDSSVVEAVSIKNPNSSDKGLIWNTLETQQQLAPIYLSAKKGFEKPSARVSSAKDHTEAIQVLPSCQESDLSSFLDQRLRKLQAATFSVNQVFRTLQKKAQHFTPHEKETIGQGSYGQRCRVDVEEAATSSSSSCGVQDSLMASPEKPQRQNRLSRTRRIKNGRGKLGDITEIEPDRHSPKSSVVYQREPFSEDVLWTDKYHPVHSCEVIGNRAAIEKLHSWLKRWKLKTDTEERTTYKEALNEEQNCWDCGDFVDEVGAGDRTEEQLSNTVLLTGPPGVGKTASVYACAMELGFKVFEVNCSSRRSGQEVFAQLKEATQSHLMETSDTESLKPVFFNSCTTVRRSLKTHTFPVKTLKKGSSSKVRPGQRRSNNKKKANPVTLTSFFKSKAKADYLYHRGSIEKSKNCAELAVNMAQKLSLTKKMATCLILFEEVDVIFEDDVGFLAAIKTLMTITKRPVILTTTDPLFRERFNGSLNDIFFHTPSMADICSYLQLVCLAENIQLDSDDVNTLFKVTRGDVRRCLLQLQFWANSGGGRSTAREFNYKGCSGNMLGLQSVSQVDLLQLLHEEQMTEILLQPLVESWRNGFPILYANLELLLHVDENERPFSELVCYGQDRKMPFYNSQQIEKNLHSAAKTKSRLSRKKNMNFLQIGASPEPQCAADEMDTTSLSALSNFFDLMSFIDASMPQTQQLAPSPYQREDFVWTGVKILDSQLDEMEEEERSQEIILDIQATLEALGFRRCNKSSQGRNASWKRGPSPALSDSQNLCLTSHHFVYQRRFDLSKKVLSSPYFSLLHNTRAACIDYLPIIRFFCRTHRKQQKQRTEEQDWYLKSFRIQLGLTKKTVELLACEFS